LALGLAPISKPGDVSPGYRRLVLGMLTLVYVVNFVDRQVLSVLLEPIRRDLDLSDTQLGLLSGLAFAAFYVTFGIPFARIADRYSRRNLIVVCMLAWSAMTALCGMAANLAQLLAARIGVAIGEAGCIAPAQSIISDYYSPTERPAALSVFSVGSPIGVFLGLLLGGWLAELYGWRMALVLIGLPGMLLALLVLWTVREPIRGMASGTPPPERPGRFLDDARQLLSRRTMPLIAVAAGMQSMVLYGMGAWLPSFYMRLHALEAGEVGTLLAVVNGIGAGLGTLGGGFLAAALARRDRRWLCWLPAIAATVATPLYAGAVLAPDLRWSIACVFPAALLGSVFVAPTLAAVHGVSGVALRATGLSLVLFLTNLVGIGGGALVVGAVSDALRELEAINSLRYGLLAVLSANLLAIAAYAGAGHHVRVDSRD
jgi:predicted MFS family arabinose efflux permease